MTSKTFTSGTVVDSPWLNDVNTATYTSVPALQTKTANLPTVSAFAGTMMDEVDAAGVRTTIAAAVSGANTDITSLSSITSINGGQLAGLRNRIINGGMQVAQRGATAVVANGGYYGGADRTALVLSGFSTITGSLGQSAMSGTTYGVGQFYTFTSTGTGSLSFLQRIEALNAISLNSKTITVSAKVYQDSGAALLITLGVHKPSATDNFASTSVIQSANISIPTGVVTTISSTFAIGAADASGGIEVRAQYLGNVGALTSKSFGISDLQLELGSVATPFEQRPIGMELALCQRYYEAGTATSDTYGGAGSIYSTYTNFCVSKRAAPTIASVFGYGNASGGSSDLVSISGFRSKATATATGAAGILNSWTATAEL